MKIAQNDLLRVESIRLSQGLCAVLADQKMLYICTKRVLDYT